MTARPAEDPRWWIDVFGEREAERMQANMQSVAEEYDDADGTELDIHIRAPIDRIYGLLPEIKLWCENNPSSEIRDFLMTVGQGLSYQYLINPDIDFDDSLSECADFFNAGMVDGIDFDESD